MQNRDFVLTFHVRRQNRNAINDNLLPTASQLETIARETSLIQRASRKFSAAGFLMAMLQSVTKGDTSLNQIVMHLASFVPKGMTRQAMFQRFDPASSGFLLKLIQSVIKQRHPAVLEVLKNAPFTRVLMEDSTVISMAKSNAANQFGWTGILANITVNSGGVFNGSLGHFIGRLALNGNASVLGTDYLGLTGGLITYNGSNSEAGSIAEDLWLGDVPGNAVSVTVSVTGNNPAGDLTISGGLSGHAGASLTKTGNGTLVLSGNNAYTGPTSIQSGKLKLTGSLHASSAVTVDSSATLMGTGTVSGPVTINSGGTIAPGASAGTIIVGSTALSGIYACEINGATADRITSPGSITINPGATLAFSTLSTPTLQSYIIASGSGSLTGTFSNVTGTPAGYGVIYDAGLKQIRLDQIGYNRWIADRGLTGAAAAFDADPDHDGIANGLEFVLGGEPNPANPGSHSAGLLPTATGSSGNMIFSFKRKVVSKSFVALTFQWSGGVIFPSPDNDIPVGAASSVTDGVSVTVTQGVPDSLTDTIVITVPFSKAVGGKLFCRLKAVQVP